MDTRREQVPGESGRPRRAPPGSRPHRWTTPPANAPPSAQVHGGAADDVVVESRGRTAWLTLALTVLAALAALAVPALRSTAVGTAAVAAPLLTVAGILRYRPRPLVPWCLVTLMLTLWGVGTVQLQVQHRLTPAGSTAVDAGQAVAVLVAVVLVRRSRDRRRDARAGGIDILVIGSVLALVAAQLVSVAAAGDGSGSAASLVVPTVDILVCGLLLRVVVVHRGLSAATTLGLFAALTTVLYDLSARLAGHRLAIPGSPGQALGTVCVMLFAAAALHPTMTRVFDGRPTARRTPSAAFLGLLPLVVVPLALWAVGRAAGTAGLPTAAFLVAGSVVAGLSLIRGAGALRSSERLAEHDALTDLLNRRGLARVFAAGPPSGGWAVLLVDIDEFKQVNETHGHDAGNDLLVAVRDRLLAHGADGVVARNDGDEFVVLTAPDRAVLVAESVVRGMQEPIRIGARSVPVTVSVGIAPAGAGTDLDELLTQADIAMYVAKGRGRNTIAVFEPRMRIEVVNRFELTGELRDLLVRGVPDHGRLEVWYQPLVDLSTGDPVGAEALVRWRHPRHGLLVPGEFLGLVNLAGLDTELDAAVVGRVVAQLREWTAQGREPLAVSVNVTRGTLLQPRFAEDLIAGLVQARVPARLMHVEITEHEELPDDAVVAANLQLLHDAGIDLHLDDYGTGFTSLTYLGRYPITLLKVDRSVVSTVGDHASRLLAGVAALAGALSLDLLAEGVETPAERDRLVDLGIRFGQGYLFSPPVPAQRYADLVLAPAPASALPVPAARTAAVPAAVGDEPGHQLGGPATGTAPTR